MGKVKHNMTDTKMYAKWTSMKRRCNNKNSKDYKNYGGRGIKVCEEWNNFINFMNWSKQHSYSDNLELDRIDNNKNYEPDNCRFVDKIKNNSNKRNNHFVFIKGEKKTISQLAKETCISRKTLQSRIKYGWNDDELIRPAKLGNNQVTFKEI